MKLPKEVIAQIAATHIKSTNENQSQQIKMSFENSKKNKEETEQASQNPTRSKANKIIHARISFTNYNTAFNNLRKHWKELHEEDASSINLTTMVDLYKKSKKVCDFTDKKSLYTGVASTKAKIQSLLAKKGVIQQKVFPSLEQSSFAFKKTALETLEALLVVELFKIIEISYKKLKEIEKKELIDASLEDLFWDKIQNMLKTLFPDAMKKLICDYYSKEPAVIELLNKFQPNVLIKKLCIQTRKLMMFRNICNKLNVQFLQYFNQEKNPFVNFGGSQCVGLTSAWALGLHQSPPRENGKKTIKMQKLDRIFTTLKEELLPNELPLTYFLMGEESSFNKSTYTFQYQYLPTFGNRILSDNEHTTEDLKGESIIQLAQSLFSNTTVSVLAVILNTINDTVLQPHMIGIARIRMPNQNTLYRMVDSQVGECEFHSLEQLSTFLDRFFSHWFYQHYFCKSTIINLDSALRLHCKKSEMERKAELKVNPKGELNKNHLWIPHADFLPQYPKRHEENNTEQKQVSKKQEEKKEPLKKA